MFNSLDFRWRGIFQNRRLGLLRQPGGRLLHRVHRQPHPLLVKLVTYILNSRKKLLVNLGKKTKTAKQMSE